MQSPLKDMGGERSEVGAAEQNPLSRFENVLPVEKVQYELQITSFLLPPLFGPQSWL